MHWSTIQTVKIAHVADCHLRNVHYGSQKRGARFLQGLLSAIRAACAADAALILCCGDILDSNNPGPAVVNWQLANVHSLLVELDMPMIVTQGNHDNCVPSWLTPYEATSAEELLEPGLHFVLDGSYVLEYDTWPCHIRLSAIPYCDKEEFLAACDSIKKTAGQQDIIMWHGEIQEFCGFPLPEAITMAEIPADSCQLLAMGHIHVHKHMTLPGGMIVSYPGSTELVSEDEDAEKRMYVYSFEGDDSKQARLTKVESLPFETQPVVRRTVKTEEDLAELVDYIKANPDTLAFIRYEKNLHDAVKRLHEAADEQLTVLRMTPMMPDRFNVHTMSREAVVRGPAAFFEANAEDLIHDDDVRSRVSGICKELLTPGTDARDVINKFCDARLGTTSL